MDKIESRLTFSEHHEEIGRWNLEDKQICGLILLVNKDEYEIGVFSEVKFAAVRVRVHSNKLIINAKFALREVHVIFHVTKGGTLSSVLWSIDQSKCFWRIQQ